MNDNCFVALGLTLCDKSPTLPDLVALLAVDEPTLSPRNLECVARQAIADFPAYIRKRRPLQHLEAAEKQLAEAAAMRAASHCDEATSTAIEP